AGQRAERNGRDGRTASSGNRSRRESGGSRGMLNMGIVPLIVITVLWLVFLEGLLSADNALVLAMMVRHLPKDEQKRALRYGIWAAFVFRAIAVGMAKALLAFWFLKVLGGVYLLYLAIAHFAGGGGDDGPSGR